MRPRVVFRTHYQVDEPAYLEILVRFCTSPTESAYREVVAERLAREIRKRNRKFNVPAAAYAVDLARGLDVINDQHRWSNLAHVVNLVSTLGSEEDDLETQLELDDIRKLMHFRVFMEGDAAALVYIAKALLEHGAIGPPTLPWNELAQSMFESIYYEYLQITTSTADRVKLRTELDRIRGKGYEGKSGVHKVSIHAQTLFRLGLIDRAGGAAGGKYRIPDDARARDGLQNLVAALPSVSSIEDMISSGSWASIAASVFLSKAFSWDASDDFSATEQVLIEAYRGVVNTGVPLAPITTVRDVIQLRLLKEGRLFLTDAFMDFLMTIQRRAPKDVRFHVDRIGKPAFLKLSDEFVEAGGLAVG